MKANTVRKTNWTINLVLGLGLLAQVAAAATLTPANLTCQSLVNPLGIDAANPDLSWISTSSDPVVRAQYQSAYEIVVADSQAGINANSGNVWDSGKVATDQSIHVRYAGKALQSHQDYYWKVRVWDGNGVASAWSAANSWTMGFLSPGWSPTWIGITNRGADWSNYTVDTQFKLLNSAAGLFFRTGGDGNAYMWQITSGASLNIRAVTNGAYTLLRTVSLASVLTGNWTASLHELKVTLNGRVFTTFVDGVLVNTLTNTDWFKMGGIGFREADGESAVFRSVTVSDAAGAVLYRDNFPVGEANAFTAGTIGTDGLTVSGAYAVFPNTWLRTPVLRKEFTLPTNKTIQRAYVYASALGLYELHLNGQKVGTDMLTPGWTDYRHLVPYQQYDVTSLLQAGNNAIGAIIAPGWFCGKVGWFGWDTYGSYPKFATELHVEFTDGTTQVVASDTSWKFGRGPMSAADLQDGWVYDARNEIAGWDKPGYSAGNSWESVVVATNHPQLVAQVEPTIGVVQSLNPVSVTQPKPGLYVYDFGQNFTGVARVAAQATDGEVITLQYAERINRDGTLDRSNLGSAKATDTYTMKGTGVEAFQPGFTFHGFRYLSVQGTPVVPDISSVIGRVIGSQVSAVGSLHTSDAKLNQLISNIRWTAHNAFMSMPMDSPQRSERLGWTGDANFQSPAAAFNFDMSRFYAKWERDVIDSVYPNAAPWIPERGHAGGGWADVEVNLPWLVWQRYGDTNIIGDSYAGMKAFLNWMQSNSSGYIVAPRISAAGDWVWLEKTSQSLLGTALYAYDAEQMSQMAAAIGKTADAATYHTLFINISNAFNSNYVKADGTVDNGSQTAYVLALHIGLLPNNLRAAAMEKLVANITARTTHLSTGYVGTQWLLNVLADNGRADIAYAVLQQTTYPSWLYEVGLNQTTLWECWNSLNADGMFAHSRTSLDHSALGSVGNWMYQGIGGLVPDEANPAFKHFFIQPMPGGTLTSASASLQSPHGLITTSWTLSGSQYALNVVVPVNTTATILLPSNFPANITENGVLASNSPGVTYAGLVNGWASYDVGSGSYAFVVK